MHRVLIIGCGAIAGGYDSDRGADQWPLSHAGAIAREPRFELSACVDPDPDTRAAFAARWSVPVAAASLGDLQAQPGSFDLIVIASPTRLHAEHLELALAMKPRAVLCEKPLAEDFSQIAALVDRYEAAKIPLIVNYTRRWAPDINHLVDEVHDGKWGAPISAVGFYSKGIVHNGSHLIDLLMMFVGPMDLRAVGPAVFDHWEHDPSVDALLATRTEGRAVHLVAGDCRKVTQFELVLGFTEGEIAIRDGGLRIETRQVRDSATFAGYRQLDVAQSEAGRYGEAMSLAYDNIAAVIAGEATPRWAAHNGHLAHALCERIRTLALTQSRESTNA